MALTTVDFNSYFDYKLSTKQIRFTDKTDFSGQGTTTSNVTVVAKVVAPISGTIYNNTNHSSPDIDPNTSLNSAIVIPLPLDSGGLPEQGTYTITLTYQDLVVGPATIVETRTFNLSYTSPIIDLSMTVDCITPQLASVDDTIYTSGTTDPTITRSHTINYPASLSLSAITGTGGTLTTNTFYTIANSTLSHSAGLTSDLTYLFSVSDSMYVIDQVTGSKFIDVSCDGDLCDIYCCIRSQWLRYTSALSNNNSVLALDELRKFKEITSLAEMIGIALRCGKSTHVSSYVAKILEIAECDSGCACADGTPALVTGLSVTGDTVVVAAGTGLSLSTVTGGGTTTYTLSLSSTNSTKLSNLKNTVIVDGSGISSVLVTTTVGGVTTDTYTITATDTIVQSLFVRMKLTMNASSVPTISITSQDEYGTTFSGSLVTTPGSEFLLNNKDATFSEWTTDNTTFTVQNFFSSGSVDYYPEVKMVNIVKPTKGDKTSWLNNLDTEIISMSASSFDIRFADSSGSPVKGLDLQNYTSIELIFKIQA